MRTTMAIDDDILYQLKHRAIAEHRTVQDVANELLRQAIFTRSKKPVFYLKLKGYKAKLQPGIDIADREHLFDIMNE
ncbi:MAG: hypothetical protein JW841_09850 [Deltaproteobacteria bacterium]|nr:hypothetical protein [Deltaproteobacteria bacterium]